MSNNKPAVVLLSGGLDSSTVLAMAKAQGYTPYALSFSYGQRHVHELQAAEAVARALGAAKHVVAQIDLREFGGSALTADVEVPKDRDVSPSAQEASDAIPVTYVPARNTIFLSFALAWAEVLGADAIFIGVNALDYSGYPDCRPDFIASFTETARLATRDGVEGKPFTIHTPLQYWGKAKIAEEAVRLGFDPAMSWSCYDPTPDGRACGLCDSCRLRQKGFAEAGIHDPTNYAAGG